MSAVLSEQEPAVPATQEAGRATSARRTVPTGPSTSVETMLAAAAQHPGPLSRPAAAAVTRPPAAGRGSRRPPRRALEAPPAPLRARLLPGTTAARTVFADGPVHRAPAPVRERIEVMRATDRSLVVECADEDRGEVPVAEPAVVVRRLALGAVDVIVGRRPAAQLARWLTPGVLHALRTRADLQRRAVSGAVRATDGARPPVLRRAYVCPLDPHLVEASAVVDDGRRVRAVALRLETHRGVWRATALDVG